MFDLVRRDDVIILGGQRACRTNEPYLSTRDVLFIM
jgi:hypothetical protein